jgi:3',5'-cyclic-nucleotide phosphodiesterase
MDDKPSRGDSGPTSSTSGTARLDIVQGRFAGQCITLEQELRIGRNLDGEGVGLSLPEPQVSRLHARIVRHRDGFFVEDMNSKNGTHLDGRRLVPRTRERLVEGAELCIGESRLRFSMRGHDQAAPPVSQSEAPFPDAGPPSIVISDAPPVEMSRVFNARSILRELERSHPVAEDTSAATLRRLRAMSRISLELGSLQDREALLKGIMVHIFEIFPAAERAFVMLCKDQELQPIAARRRDGSTIDTQAMSLSRTIVDEVLHKQQAVLTVNAMQDARYREHESVLLHSLRSVICAPLLIGDEVLGLIQVDTEKFTVEFDEDDLETLAGISVQAAIAVKNAQLYASIEHLFEGFVSASVVAIEARDPSTAGHSFRVATFTERLAVLADRCDTGAMATVSINRAQLREIRFAALLHDFGKVGVREHILTKPTKLYPEQLATIRERFERAKAHVERFAWRELVEELTRDGARPSEVRARRTLLESGVNEELARLDEFLNAVLVCNRPAVTHTDPAGQLAEVRDYSYVGRTRADHRLLTGDEYSSLLIGQGSLTRDERIEIESHVKHTLAFLRQIPWTSNLQRLPEIAHGHHEKLDGSGYPNGAAGAAIPLETRMLTIADIYDALTAGDRPYKKGMAPDQALDILREEADAGKIDPLLLELFIEGRAYRTFDEPR